MDKLDREALKPVSKGEDDLDREALGFKWRHTMDKLDREALKPVSKGEDDLDREALKALDKEAIKALEKLPKEAKEFHNTLTDEQIEQIWYNHAH